MIERSMTEIDDLANRAIEAAEKGSKWPGMSYEAGVAAVLEWLTYKDAVDPLEDE